ncbi:MAG: DUF1064 domain-containing protein [Oscillospiraceae bacterium]|nr:DUF1064 domain-containing protein [Oscillospiraceae bacterium]
MGVSLESLSPWAQRQVIQKLTAAEAKKKAAKESKYHNQQDERATGSGAFIRFDSKKEARRFDELLAMLRTGRIRGLKLQPQFTLQEAYTTAEGVRVRAIRYQADFSYELAVERPGDETGWVLVVEDVKSRATKTRVYAMKKKLMQERFGIDIQEV